MIVAFVIVPLVIVAVVIDAVVIVAFEIVPLVTVPDGELNPPDIVTAPVVSTVPVTCKFPAMLTASSIVSVFAALRRISTSAPRRKSPPLTMRSLVVVMLPETFSVLFSVSAVLNHPYAAGVFANTRASVIVSTFELFTATLAIGISQVPPSFCVRLGGVADPSVPFEIARRTICCVVWKFARRTILSVRLLPVWSSSNVTGVVLFL